MKKTIIITSIFALSACGGGGPSPGNNTEEKIRELGTCSAVLVSELNVAEMDFNLYRDYGLSYGRELVRSHIDYLNIQKRYGDVSCDAIDHNTGEIIKITRDYINRLTDKVYSEIRAADSGKCRNSYSSLTAQEKSGCSQIKMYLKPNNGY